MTTETELLPCPHCGGAVELIEGEESAYIQCTHVKMHRSMFFDGDNNAADEVRQQWNRRSPPSGAEQGEAVSEEAVKAAMLAPTHRHKKSGAEYVLIGFGKMQTEFWLQLNPTAGWAGHKNILVTDGTRAEGVDMREVAIYRSVAHGLLWVRPYEEFEDGRFEVITSPQEGGE